MIAFSTVIGYPIINALSFLFYIKRYAGFDVFSIIVFKLKVNY